MNLDVTDITFLLDRSGSMQSICNDVIGGFNSFLDEQKRQPGECAITLIQFDSVNTHEVTISTRNVREADRLNLGTFVPRGGTPLLDAMCEAIDATGARLKALPQHQRPGKVVFVVFTDGAENQSQKYTKDDLAERIKHQQDKYNWQFVFLGANFDAFAMGNSLGIARGSTMTYAATAGGTKLAFASMSHSMADYRSKRTTSASYSLDPKAQEDALKDASTTGPVKDASTT